jgi:hypothetical protein
MFITKIYVEGEPDEVKGSYTMSDLIWKKCRIDDSDVLDIRITVRHWGEPTNGIGEPTLPILVYIDQCVPLYPTYVYRGDELLAVDPGKIGIKS